MKIKMKHLEIILKISERCNINCSYCYVFNKGNSAADHSPALISQANVDGLVDFINKSYEQFDIESLQIDFHGGEPLMMKKGRFAALCDQLETTRRPGSNLRLALQTNAVLINEEWIDLFSKYDIVVGISIDGTREINDLYRLDKRGRSTYDRTINGLRKLQAAYADGQLLREPGILCVVNPQASGAEVYRHFVDDLKVRYFDFLLPDDNHNDDNYDNEGVGQFMLDAFDEWIKDDHQSVRVRTFDTYLATMMGTVGAGVLGHTPYVEGVFAFTVGSDGLIRVDDTLRSTCDKIFDPIGHIASVSLKEVLQSPASQEYEAIGRGLPSACTNCVWKTLCSGGRIVNRFSVEKRFDNKTIFCGANRRLLSRSASHLMSIGFSEQRLEAALGL